MIKYLSYFIFEEDILVKKKVKFPYNLNLFLVRKLKRISCNSYDENKIITDRVIYSRSGKYDNVLSYESDMKMKFIRKNHYVNSFLKIGEYGIVMTIKHNLENSRPRLKKFLMGKILKFIKNRNKLIYNHG